MGFWESLFKPKAQKEDEAEKSARIMERLKARRGQETGKWLAIMENASKAPPPVGPPPTIEDIDKREVLDEVPYTPPLETQYTPLYAQEQPPERLPAGALGNQTVAGVEKFFTELKRQADEYNTNCQGGDFELMVNAPEYTFEKPHDESTYDDSKTLSIFKGSIVAQHWAMLVQGYEDRIEVYIISADEILNYTLNDIRNTGVSPFMLVESVLNEGKRVWSIEGTAVSEATMPALAQVLLGDLIRVDTGTMSESELFANAQGGLKLGVNVAQGYQAPA